MNMMRMIAIALPMTLPLACGGGNVANAITLSTEVVGMFK